MRNIGKNILVHSDERAIMINPAGQILYEVPFEGSGKTVVEIFQDRNGEIVSCFVRGDFVAIFRENQFKGSF